VQLPTLVRDQCINYYRVPNKFRYILTTFVIDKSMTMVIGWTVVGN